MLIAILGRVYSRFNSQQIEKRLAVSSSELCVECCSFSYSKITYYNIIVQQHHRYLCGNSVTNY